MLKAVNEMKNPMMEYYKYGFKKSNYFLHTTKIILKLKISNRLKIK